MSGNYNQNQFCRMLENSENYTGIEMRNPGIRFRETSLEAESPSGRTVSSVFVEVMLKPLQGPALVFVEKGNLKGSVSYFYIVDFRGR